MTKFAVSALLAAVAFGATVRAAEPGAPPPVQKEHEWLKQFAGEWELDGEMLMGPGQPAVKTKGTETARQVGGYWVASEIKGECMGAPMTGMMTVGYDPARKKYVGSWVCSMSDHLWTYEGTVDSSGKVLTLETEGPNCAVPGKTAKMRDVTEFKADGSRVLTSSMLGEDGKWHTFMTMTARRKK